MSIEKINEMPKNLGRITPMTELVQAVDNAVEGTILKWTREDGEKVTTAIMTKTIETRTGKMVRIRKLSPNSVGVQILKKTEHNAELREREIRAKEMATKLKGKQ